MVIDGDDDDIEKSLAAMEKELESLDGNGWPSRAAGNIDRKSGVTAFAARYFLRMLAGTGAFKRFYGEWMEWDGSPGEGGREVLSVLGLPAPRAGMSSKQGSRFLAQARSCCKQRLVRLEKRKIRTPELTKALDSFRRHLGLDTTECGLLAFASVLHGEDWFRQICCTSFGQVNDKHGYSLVAQALAAPYEAVKTALAPGGKLAQSGLLTWDRNGAFDLDDKLECVQGLPAALLQEGAGPMELLAKRCRLAPAAATAPADFDYLETEVRLLRQLFAESLQRGSGGVNVLLYGEPGVGKTELARVLAAVLSSELWEVGCEDEAGDSVAPQERLANFRVAQAMLRGRKDALLLFDEAEDAFPEELPFFGMRAERESKAWVNQLLEKNSVPTLWLSNKSDGIDGAHLRRFLYVLEVPQPPRRVRLNMLKQRLAPVGVPKPWLERISADERLVPGHIERARRLIEHLGKVSPEEARLAAEQAFVNTLHATGVTGPLKGGEAALTRYRPEFLNADADLAVLAEGIVRRGAGRLCLYGAPGTGKSAFARHLAEQAGKPLIYRRASDLMSPWVGVTEKLIAALFEEARREGAAVLLDEADSFLAAREAAFHSWEVTRVNELLTQMEAFEGLFIAATNLMDRLDSASIRRFDLKIRFGYLKPEQARAMLAQVLEEHSIVSTAEETEDCERIGTISNLTPGDFAAVIRRARLDTDATTASWWVRALERECSAKPDAPRSTLGFLATRAS